MEPQTYTVTLSDGRVMDVTTEGGPPSEADIMAHLSTEAPKTPAAPASAVSRFATGFARELPQVQTWPGRLARAIAEPAETFKGVLRGIGQNVDASMRGDMLKPDYQAPEDTALGRMQRGDIAGGLGGTASIFGQALVAEAAPRIVRGKLQPKVDLTPVRAGSLTQEQLAERALGAQEARRAGTLKSKPEPALKPPATVKERVQVAAPEDLPSQTDMLKTAEKFAEPRKFSSDMTDQPGPFGQLVEQSSGAVPGSPEAKFMRSAHAYDAETVNRYQHMLANENGYISPSLLRTMGLPARYAIAGMAAKQVGAPAWLGAGGLAATDLVRAHPVGSAEVLRAAILARLTAPNGSEP